MAEEEKGDTSLKNPDVVTKYKMAGEFCNKVLAATVESLKVGAKIVDLCAASDKMIDELCAAVYKTGKVLKGVAFPTCISVNNCMGHFSPLSADQAVLKEGDVAKIDLGVHIDGYIAVAAHTVVVSDNKELAVTGKHANVIAAAYMAAETVLHLIKPGVKNTDITPMISKVTEIYHCNPVEHVTSCQMKQFVIAANKTIASKASKTIKTEECVFEENEVYALDIVVSTGEGKGRELDLKPTIFKRNVEINYNLKLQASRSFMSEINARSPTMPFTLRSLTSENKAKLGVTECLQHNLLEPYPVIYEKDPEIVAQFKYTVLLMPTQTMKLTGLATGLPATLTSEYTPTDEIKEIIARNLKPVKPKKKKAAAGASSDATGSDSNNNNNKDAEKDGEEEKK